jgi:hypothetical protein
LGPIVDHDKIVPRPAHLGEIENHNRQDNSGRPHFKPQNPSPAGTRLQIVFGVFERNQTGLRIPAWRLKPQI